MAEQYTIPLSKVIDEFSLNTLYMPKDPSEILVKLTNINRPGLVLAGFYDHYENDRIQVIGKVEHVYLGQMPKEQCHKTLDTFFSTHPVAVIVTTELDLGEDALELAKKHGVPLLGTQEKTSLFTAGLIAYLNVQLAPRLTTHGVLMEVYGEGILLLGDSGIGKSETAIELLKRGHRLIADDAVEIKRVSAKSLVGRSPDLIRHYMELRGIGIVNVCRIFGMGAVKETENINLVINLEPWEQGKNYDRLGIEEQYTDILGIRVPSLTIPVRPGRNLAIIIEIAAMNHRQKKMGYNTPKEFNERLMASIGAANPIL